MKKRWIIVLSVVGILIIGGVSAAYIAMDYGVKRALDLMADDRPVPAETTESMDSTVPDEREAEPIPDSPSTTTEEDQSTEIVEEKIKEIEEVEETNEAAEATEAESTVEVSDGEETDEKETEIENNEVSSSSHNYIPNVSAERAKKVEEEISFSEKTKVTTVLLKSFNASDIRLLTDLASGGLSTEEKREAKKLFLERLSPEDYDELIQIAANYGLSQGKSYAESTSDLEK